jgi:hypothetical protein
MLVVGGGLLTAGVLMMRAAIRARIRYHRAVRNWRRISARVVANKTGSDDSTQIYSPVVEFTDPRTGRQATFSPSVYTSRQVEKGLKVDVLWDERGAEPILDLRPFGAGLAGSFIFLVLAILCAGCGALAIYAVAF